AGRARHAGARYGSCRSRSWRCSMFQRKQALARRGATAPFAILRQMTSELDRVFDDWPAFRWPSLQSAPETTAWMPKIDVFQRENRLVTRVDLPGLTREDVAVEVTDGQLVLSGERKREKEEKKEDFYRAEREYGS